MHEIVLIYASQNPVCVRGHVASFIRLDLDRRMVYLKFLLEQLSNFVKSIAWIDVCNDMGSQNWLSFSKGVYVKIVNLINDRQLQNRVIIQLLQRPRNQHL